MFDPMSQEDGLQGVTTWVDDNNFKFEMFAVDPAVAGDEGDGVMAKRK